jgi:hypothetical protein
MTNSHLTDETLQAFLLKETQDDAVVMHLSACAACSTKLENYQQLMVAMQKLAPDSFTFDVTTLVMDSIVQYEKQESRKQAVVFGRFLPILLLVIVSFSIPFIPSILTIFTSIPIFTMLLILGTGLVILLFVLAEVIKQYKMKEEKIFQHISQPIL